MDALKYVFTSLILLGALSGAAIVADTITTPLQKLSQRILNN